MVRHPTIAALFWPQPHVWRSCSEQEELERRREESRGRGWSSRRDQAGGLVEKQEARSCGRKRGTEGGPSRRYMGGVEDRRHSVKHTGGVEDRRHSVKHTHSQFFTYTEDFSVFYRARSSGEGPCRIRRHRLSQRSDWPRPLTWSASLGRVSGRRRSSPPTWVRKRNSKSGFG